MRSLLVLAMLVLNPAPIAQPIDRPTLKRTPKPSIHHQPIRSGPPTTEFYYVTDTIVVSITGHVKLDGNCSGRTPLYGFQRKEGNRWTDHLPPCNVQLCCGMPDRWFQETVALIPAHVARPAYGKPWKPGEYHAVVLLVGDKELMGPPFRVVDEP